MDNISVENTVKKRRSTFQKLLFSRAIVILLIMLAQIAFLTVSFLKLGTYTPFIMSALTVLSVVAVIYILNKGDDPAFQIVWIILIVVVPVLGILFYTFVQLNMGMRHFKKGLNIVMDETAKMVEKNEGVLDELKGESQNAVRMANYLYKFGGYATYKNTDVIYFPQGEDKYDRMIRELESAKSFIFMEYYIIEEGFMWNSILEILELKVKQGVEVRVMYDGIGTLLTLPVNYYKKLTAKGIKSKEFNPIHPIMSTQQNNRDHRKILVIDGRVAFTGGINLADEYINKKEVYGHWKDAAIMLRGEAVKNFTLMFLQLWNVNEKLIKNRAAYSEYVNTSTPIEANGYVTAYGDNPLDGESVGETIYLNIIYGAKEYVHIMTPYLIITSEMLTALKTAAKSGVDVKLLLPHIPDKWYAFVIAKSYYPELINAGVKIYEYTPGFIHSKVFVCDNRKAIVGTINLDYRSLYLHFECAAFLYKTDCIKDIEKDFANTIAISKRIRMEEYKANTLFDRIAGKVLRLLSPLM